MANRQKALDSYDRAILAELQRDNTIPHRLIGRRVHLSAAAVNRRIRRMTAEGVIRANVAILDPASVGQALVVVIEIELSTHDAKTVQSAKALFQAHDAVRECYYVTGDVDIIAVLTVPDMAGYVRACGELLDGSPFVRRYKSFIVVESLKLAYQVPITH
jgi:Lrp/AsnC family transcriptional regulator, leucine-responsive regulatory protein